MEGIVAIWYRDILKFFRDRSRILGSFAMPFMFLILFGSGMSGAIGSLIGGTGGASYLKDFNYVQFMFPGIIGMTVFNTAMFSSLSVVQDREFGYLREILVSPISRTSVAIGKVLGGTSVAIMQGLLMLIFAPFIGAKLTVPMITQLIPVMFLVAFTISSIGLLIASAIKSTQGFQMIIQLLIFPMIFLSGAMFPLNGLPGWMSFLVKINPMTYSVDMFKSILLEKSTMNPMLREAMGLNLKIFDIPVTFFGEVMFFLLVGALFVTMATLSFKRSNA